MNNCMSLRRNKKFQRNSLTHHLKIYTSLCQRKQSQETLGSDGFTEKKRQVSKTETRKALVYPLHLKQTRTVEKKENYRPISYINTNKKTLKKFLANSTQQSIKHIMAIGFLPIMQGRFNFRKLTTVISLLSD